MKGVPLFLLGFISMGILSCGNKTQTTNIAESSDINDAFNEEEIIEETIEELPVNPYQKYNFPPVDSLKFVDNLRLLDSIEDNNRDSVFKVITSELKRFIDENNIDVPENGKEKLELWEALLHHLYGYNWWEAQAMWEMYYYRHINEMGDKYLSYYIHNLLFKKVNGTLARKLKEEQILKDGLISAQREFLMTHIDEAIDEGSSSNMKYFTVASMINKDHAEAVKELYFSLTGSNTITTDYQDLPTQLFDREYNHISNDLIPVEPEYEHLNPDYDENKDRQTLWNEKKAWEKFIAKRQEISSMLSGNNKKVWDNATNRFKKSHLILLKNEFQGLGVVGNEMMETLLSDDCTYEELFAYPNFSTKWKEN